MASIWSRGPYQFCVRIRRNGVSETKTFESRREAEHWARVTEGKVAGNEFVDYSKAQETTLTHALEWYEKNVVPQTPRSAKVKRSNVAYWRASKFADWALVSIQPWDLLDWRREVLDEDNADDDRLIGPAAQFGEQTCVHKLNTISHVYGQWSLIHRVPLANPVVRGVRPKVDNARDRRLVDDLDRGGTTEEQRLHDVCDNCNSPWLGAAVRIAIETCIRQAELSGLTWGRVRLGAPHPHIDLPKTKNDRARRVPLSKRAVKAFKTLKPASSIIVTDVKVLPIETPRAIGHAFRAVLKDERFPNLRWHDLRHEGISRLFENTDLRDHEIMAITGHLSPEMLKRYSHLRSHRLAGRLG